VLLTISNGSQTIYFAKHPSTLRGLSGHSTTPFLHSFPNRGRPGKKPGTRELVVRPLPYIVVYQVSEDVVYVVRILHGAQKWPD